MVSNKVIIKNKAGLHLRPAGVLCKEAINFNSHISLKINDTTANVKSILSVLGAGLKCGDEIELICDGEDEELALNKLTDLINEGLGENEV